MGTWHAEDVLALGGGGEPAFRRGAPTLGTEPVWSIVQTASSAHSQRPTGHPPGKGLKQHLPACPPHTHTLVELMAIPLRLGMGTREAWRGLLGM